MSAQSIQRKIDVAHKKISNKLGYKYTLYRPLRNNDVLDDANIVDDVNLTVTLSDTYTKALSWELPVYTAYTNAAIVQEGDFLWSEDEGRTFLVLSRQPHQPVLVLEMPDRIDIQTVGYGDSGDGFSPDAVSYTARNLPACISYGASGFAGLSPARGAGTAGIRNATIYTSLPKSSMLMGQTVNNQGDGFRGDIVNYDYAQVGNAVKFTVQEFDVAR